MSAEAVAIAGAAVGVLGVLVPMLLTLGRRIDALAAGRWMWTWSTTTEGGHHDR